LKDIVPKLSRVAVFGSSSQPGNGQALREIQLAAKTLGVDVQYSDVLSPKDIVTGFRTAKDGPADAVMWLVAGLIGTSQRKEVAELAVKSRLPAIYNNPG